MPRYSPLIAVLAMLAAGRPAAADPVTVVTWGGAYETAQRRALFEPFTAETGIDVEVARYDGALSDIETRAADEGWDVIDMLEGQAIAACEAGLVRRLDHGEILAQEDSPASFVNDFAPAKLRDCTVPQNVYATVMAYDDRAFPGVKPGRIEDFFDLDRFPGKRAVQESPDVILEWALMAEGVPAAQVYDLLSTDRGLRLALDKLDDIRDAIVWWQEAGESAELLRDGEVAMASGYNGRFFSLAREGAPVTVVWDGRLIGYDVWAVPETADDVADAEAFLRFASAPQRQAHLAELIPYGPARRSALERVGFHPDARIPMRDHLPNAPQHDGRELVSDSQWYAHTRAMRQRRFEDWLAQE